MRQICDELYTSSTATGRCGHDVGESFMSANMGEDTSPFVDQLADGPGVSRIDPSDPAAPMYRLLALMRSPVASRDLMIQPVRTG
jgi:hypothetical protein